MMKKDLFRKYEKTGLIKVEKFIQFFDNFLKNIIV